MKVRELYVEIKQRGGVAVQNVLKGIARNSESTRKAFSGLADAVVSDAARMAAALRDAGDAMRAVRVPGGARVGGGMGGGGGGTGRRSGGDPPAGPIADANRREFAGERSRLAAEALARGSQVGTAARSALGPGGTDAQKARANALDLSAALERNRREMAALRAEAVRTGDADKRLAAQQRGLQVASMKLALDIRRAKVEVAAFDREARKASQGTGVLSRSFGVLTVAAGNLLSAGISRAVSAVGDTIADAGKKSIEFESSMAQVAKVVDGLKTPTGETTAEFGKMSEGLKTLSTQVGLEGGAGAFAKLAAAIGETGLEKSTEGILRFSEDAAKTAVAFDVTAEEAGEGLAKLRSGLGLTQDEVVSLAGTFNVLSNEGASSARDLLDAGLRVSAVGKAANVSGQEIAALNSTMLSAGETPERAATATKNFVLALSAGEAATKRQRAALKSLGLDAAEVAKHFTGTADQRIEVTNRVLAGLKDLNAADRAAATTFLFGKESLGGIAAVTTNIDGYNKALHLALDTTKAASSVQDEYNVRSQTTANQLQLLKNNVDNAKIAIGDALVPVLADVAPMLVDVAKAAAAWLKENKDLVTSELKSFVMGVIGAGQTLVPILVDAAKFVAALVDTIGGSTVAVVALGAAVAGLVGPFGVVAAAAAAAGYAIASMVDGAEAGLMRLRREADVIRAKELDAKHKKHEEEMAEGRAEIARSANADARREVLAEQYANKLRAQGLSENDIDRKVLSLRQASKGNGRWLGGGTEEERLDAWGALLADSGGGGGATAGGNNLKASRRKGRKHKQTKMDKNLSRLDPALAGVLTQGGEEDSGGDLKVSGDPLSRAAYKRSAGIAGGIGSSGGASWPNITNQHIEVNIDVDARGNEGAAANVHRAAERLAKTGQRAVLVGLEKVIATRHAGGRLTAG